MLFIIQIETSVPADTPEDKKEHLRNRELERACELIGLGKLRRIWRIVGKVGSCSVWETDTLEELHALLQSLPYFPYMKISVMPVIHHPAAQLYVERHGALPVF